MFTLKGKYTDAVVQTDRLDSNCISQIQGMINHVAFDQPVVIMPDAHAGKGAVVGFTMPLGSKIVPNIIGVDIGCGMTYAPLDIAGLQSLPELDQGIRRTIPFGFMVHDESTLDSHPEYDFWHRAQSAWTTFVRAYSEKFGESMPMGGYDREWFDATLKRINCSPTRAYNSIGTLGGGNHFIEFARDDDDGNIWLVIHSGSRKFGESVCTYWQRRAMRYQEKSQKQDVLDEINRLKAEKQTFAIATRIAELKASRPQQVRGLEWLETLEDKFGYMHDMLFAQQYASFNRYCMFKRVTDILDIRVDSIDECVHNFIDPEDMIIRKGAIRASAGASCLIPFNMAEGSVGGVGRGNPEWNSSAPHGAGRAMSRSRAKKELRLDEFRAQMRAAGVWSSSICRSTIDEAPDAYKPVKPLLDCIGETVDVCVRLRPILNLKAK